MARCRAFTAGLDCAGAKPADRYVEAEEKLVDDLQKFAAIESDKDWQKGADTRQGGPEKGEANGAELLEAVQVGNYKIQPIKATGDKGGTELNAWLDDNGFGRVSESVLKFYLNKGHFWLAVKLSKEGGLPANGTVKPLQSALPVTSRSTRSRSMRAAA